MATEDCFRARLDTMTDLRHPMAMVAGKAKMPYEFRVEVNLTATHKQGLMVGARSFTGSPYDGRLLAA